MRTVLSSATPTTAGRIQSIEIFRLIASFFVIFIHYRFPGKIGDALNALARFAVPFFFMTTGYFSYNATPQQIKKRMHGIAKLAIVSSVFYLLWGSYVTRYVRNKSRLLWLRKVFSLRKISSFLFLNTNPISGHLWYFNAVFACYIVIYIYLYWKSSDISYHPLYCSAFPLLTIHFLLGTIATTVDIEVPYTVFRNALFFGYPLFVLGIFLREYQDRLIGTFHLSNKHLLSFIFLGTVLTLLECFGSGKTEMPVGSLICAIAAMLFLVRNPCVTQRTGILSGLISRCSSLSAWIYITHVFWADIYSVFGIGDYLSNCIGDTATSYLKPIAILLLSLLTGFLWSLICSMYKSIKRS